MGRLGCGCFNFFADSLGVVSPRHTRTGVESKGQGCVVGGVGDSAKMCAVLDMKSEWSDEVFLCKS